ncbi:MAG: hypothetical protein B7C24_15370 [Bacteroidetes bacterium 4572_77]|nr:MAG: hypothetical protein B7C24_15370 [Bacteroidetes bacterium 4572_77]
MQTATDIIDLFELKQPCGISPRGYYSGQPLEKGGTSIPGKAAPAIRWLFNKGYIKSTDKVLDYGAGKFGRNGIFLREQGCEVFCYDPFNGTDKNGWNGVAKTISLPSTLFDVAFSCFVLNVVPFHTEQSIIKEVNSFAKYAFHVTRNTDIFDSIKKALGRKDKLVGKFFLDNFATDLEKEQYEAGELDEDTILEFCMYGVQTSKGFQRIPCCEKQGMKLLRSTGGFKIYES